MQRKFLSNLTLLILLNLLVKPFYILGIDAEVQNRVGEADYGTYFALLNITYIFNIITDFGITNFNNRNISQYSQLLQKHFSRLFQIRLYLAGVYFLFTLACGWILDYGEFELKLLGLLAVNQVLVAFILFFRSNLAALQMFRRDSIVSVMDRVLLIVSVGIVLWGGVTEKPFQIEWFVFLQTFCYLLTFLFAFVSVLRYTGKFNWNKGNFPFGFSILRQSWPYAILILISFVYNRIDSVMLERMLPDGDVQSGLYAQGYRFFEAANMFAYLFAVLLLPMFSKMIKNKESVRDLLGISSRLLIPASFILAVSSAVFCTEILSWRYGELLYGADTSFAFLMFSFVAVSGGYIFGTLLTANGSLRVLNKLAVIGLVVNVLMNLWLIPRYHAVGAAVATLITQFIVFFGQLWTVRKEIKIEPNVRLIIGFIIFFLLTLGSIPVALNYFSNWIWGFLFIVLAGIFSAWITGILNLRLYYQAVRYK